MNAPFPSTPAIPGRDPRLPLKLIVAAPRGFCAGVDRAIEIVERALLKFGAPVSPTLGAILVFWRGKRTGWLGHVGFYTGEDTSAYHVLGGNQGDKVSITRIAKERLLEARWPATPPATST